jgi:UDP-glucose 4-epimerase
MAVLVTGGAGFIGSHTVVALQQSGIESVILDDFSNSAPSVLNGIEAIIGYKPVFYNGSCANTDLLASIFTKHNIQGVIHFAANKAVGQSVANPLKYYHNNVAATVQLLSAMQAYGVHNIVFSSSCTVYGQPDSLPVTEHSPVQQAASPYGNTKQICEEILQDCSLSAQPIRAIALRYFNPIGAHSTAHIGELPNGTPSNLVPFITQVAAGIRPFLQIFGNNYPTPDGTCIRDYIHVLDLAQAHVAALDLVVNSSEPAYYDFVNIGTGAGYSVLEIVKIFEEVNNLKINYKIENRRAGDVTAIYADVQKAKQLLGWQSKYSIAQALESAWAWQKKISDIA